jgi:AsmA-like C-terminal region
MAIASPPSLNERRKLPIARVLLGLFAVVLVITFIIVGLNWPFTKAAVTKSLEQASSSQVEITGFHGTYFPHPGCVAEKVIFRRTSGSTTPPLITISRLIIQSSYLGLLAKRITRIVADGMTVFIPAQPSAEKFSSSSHATIDELVANNSTLEFESRVPGKQPTRFAIHELRLREIAEGRAVTFHVSLTNPEPPGEITANGKLGPWRLGKTSQTPVSGEYVFEHADLSVFQGIGGLLSSTGKFDGTLGRIGVLGAAEVPDFRVTGSSHRVDLKTNFNAFVNAKTGDVLLDRVESQFGNTKILTTGSIARKADQNSRVTELDINAHQGRIQDFLNLFIVAQTPPMTGITSLHAHVLFRSGKRPFLKKVELKGEFGINSGDFTAPQTQENVNKLSAEARAENDRDPGTALSDLKGNVTAHNGRAEFSYLSFTIAGAFAIMQGTYDLISEKINLHGVLRLDSSLSHTEHGPRALLLKALQPFFKRHGKGSKVAVKITGTYDHPSFGVDLAGQKENATTRRLRELYQKPTK